MPATRLHPASTEERQRIGQALRTQREAAGLRLIDIGDALDLSVGYLANVEKGRRRLTPELLSKIAARLGVAPEAITGERAA
jgi:transcriptional regulator with XRE-family HTH domain